MRNYPTSGSIVGAGILDRPSTKTPSVICFANASSLTEGAYALAEFGVKS